MASLNWSTFRGKELMVVRQKPILFSICWLVFLTCGNLHAEEPKQFLSNPKNARDLALMRAYYDKTVWKQEVLAQDYERVIVDLWDKLIRPTNKFEAMATASFRKLILGADAVSKSLDWNIQHTSFKGKKDVSQTDWPALLKSFEQLGYEIIETEWHHSEFIPPTKSKPAHSVVSASIYATHPKTKTRYIVKGDLHIRWNKTRDAKSKKFHPDVVDATRLTILSRKGSEGFVEKGAPEFRVDPTGRSAPPTTHPIILQDLNGDHLPEISVVGSNRVFWNLGNWKFNVGRLVKHPTRFVNAGSFGDFDGDGILDLIVAPKLGFPKLYVGEKGGKFETPGKQLKFTEKRLDNPVGFTVGDIDNDGDLDLFIGQNRVGYQTGDIPTPYYDARDSFPSYLLLNDGNGKFRDVTLAAGLKGKNTRRNFSSSFVDIDDDNDLDLLLTNDFQGNDLFLNDGTGNFVDATNAFTPTSYGHGMSHSFGDYNADGKLDFIFIAMSSTTARRLDKLQLGRSEFPKHNQIRQHMGYGNRMYLNTGNGFKQAPFNQTVARTGWSWGSTTFDFDRDGDHDIYITNGQLSGKTTRDYCTRYWCHDLYYQSETRPKAAISDFFGKMGPLFSNRAMSWNGFEHNSLLMNLGKDGFINVGFLMNCGSVLDSRMTVCGDIDLDGRIDLLFEHRQESNGLHFLKNEWNDSHHWIGFHLPSSAYGTKVKIVMSDGTRMTQHYVTGHSVWAQHPSTIHFGLGDRDGVKMATITWPDGTTKEISNPKIDRYLSVGRS